MSKVTEMRVGGRFNYNYVLVVEGSEESEYWGRNSGAEHRDYTPVLIKKITKNQALKMAEAYKNKKEEENKKENEKIEKENERKIKIEALAGEYNGLFLNKRGEVEDQVGNYLFSLPREIPENVEKWINDEMDAYMAHFE